MSISQRFGNWLQYLRSTLYRGYFRKILRTLGVNKYLSFPYWKLTHKLSDRTQAHTINDEEVEFWTEYFTEFMRFKDIGCERETIRRLLQSLEPDDVFYDIGANVGLYSCFASSKLNSDRVISFEPEPQNAARLEENLELNGFSAMIREIALSDFNGTTNLSLSGDETGEGEHRITTDDKSNTITVQTRKGDSVIKKTEIPPPTVLKIDVEGAELSVLRGLQKSISNHVRLAYIEVHPEKLSQFGDSKSEIYTFLKQLGFEVTIINQRNNELFLQAIK